MNRNTPHERACVCGFAWRLHSIHWRNPPCVSTEVEKPWYGDVDRFSRADFVLLWTW